MPLPPIPPNYLDLFIKRLSKFLYTQNVLPANTTRHTPGRTHIRIHIHILTAPPRHPLPPVQTPKSQTSAAFSFASLPTPLDTSQQATSSCLRRSAPRPRPIIPMADPQPQPEALTEPARINGAAAEATLSGGELAWRPAAAGGGGGEGQERRLELESGVLGCRVEGRKLRVATFAASGGGDGERPSAAPSGGVGKGGGGGGEVVLEMESEDAAARWGDAIRDRLASLGNSSPAATLLVVIR